MSSLTDSDESHHLLDKDLIVNALLPLDLIQTPKYGKVAEQADVFARRACGDRGNTWSAFGIASILDLPNKPRGNRVLDAPDFAPCLIDPLDDVRWEEAWGPGRVLPAELLACLVLLVRSLIPFAPAMLERVGSSIAGRRLREIRLLRSSKGNVQISLELESIQEEHRWRTKRVLRGRAHDDRQPP